MLVLINIELYICNLSIISLNIPCRYEKLIQLKWFSGYAVLEKNNVQGVLIQGSTRNKHANLGLILHKKKISKKRL